jgi:hypothetical protein
MEGIGIAADTVVDTGMVVDACTEVEPVMVVEHVG